MFLKGTDKPQGDCNWMLWGDREETVNHRELKK